ncbi:MAG TPA: hypothetical protein VFL57_21255 [Bryobacteraceae bacterium]|nr:hypothetical protein [Bryobacteraceae bacterium]
MTREEYERLRDASEGQGARSVSEFARNTLLGPPAAHTHCDALIVLEDRITKVEQDVAQVKDELANHIHQQPDPSITA